MRKSEHKEGETSALQFVALQVYLMDKRYVDPRRPKGTPTADEKAEMLPPYDPELPFAANLYASHKELVEGLKGNSR